MIVLPRINDDVLIGEPLGDTCRVSPWPSAISRPQRSRPADATVCWHRDKLYATFGHYKGQENTATEVAHGRTSPNGGITWGPVFAIDDRDTSNPAVSHGVLLSHAGKLWVFHGAFYDRMLDVHTRAFVLEFRNKRTRRTPVGARLVL